MVDNDDMIGLMMWLDRRLEYADIGTYPIYVRQFQRQWIMTIGSLDSVPQSYKNKVDLGWKKLKEATK